METKYSEAGVSSHIISAVHSHLTAVDRYPRRTPVLKGNSSIKSQIYSHIRVHKYEAQFELLESHCWVTTSIVFLVGSSGVSRNFS